MRRCSTEDLQNWMGGALIKRLDALEADEILLDASIRIAGFDRQWNLTAFECKRVCRMDEIRRGSSKLFAVDQRRSELHFAIRQLASYEIGIQGKTFCFGANAKQILHTSDMYSLRPLLELAVEQGSLTMAEAYCAIQPEIEGAWRRLIAEEMRTAKWHRDDCFLNLKAMEEMLDKETSRLFRSVGLITSGGLRIEGVSAPILIRE